MKSDSTIDIGRRTLLERALGRTLAVTATLFCGSVDLAAQGLLEGEFRNPSATNRPETYVFFIGGNVAKPGITADRKSVV